MSLITEYGLDSPARALLVLVLVLKDSELRTPMNKLHFQKTILYFERIQQQKDIDFSNFHYGGVSYELQENIESLEESGLVNKIGTKYELTPEGEKAARELANEYDKETIRKLEFAKKQLNDLPDKELLYYMYKLFPDTQVNSIEYKKLDVDKQAIVCRLFKKDRIPAYLASKWLNMSEKEFLENVCCSG